MKDLTAFKAYVKNSLDNYDSRFIIASPELRNTNDLRFNLWITDVENAYNEYEGTYDEKTEIVNGLVQEFQEKHHK